MYIFDLLLSLVYPTKICLNCHKKFIIFRDISQDSPDTKYYCNHSCVNEHHNQDHS